MVLTLNMCVFENKKQQKLKKNASADIKYKCTFTVCNTLRLQFGQCKSSTLTQCIIGARPLLLEVTLYYYLRTFYCKTVKGNVLKNDNSVFIKFKLDQTLLGEFK